MLRCPFHDDKTPSFQTYPQTITYCCFSSNCTAGTGDVIEFIRLMEQTTKHEAILKAISMITPSHVTEMNHAKLFKVFEGNLKKSGKAQEYLKSRGLTVEALEAGFNGMAWTQMKECVIFPLKDKDDRIVSLYGRSVNVRGYRQALLQQRSQGTVSPLAPVQCTHTGINGKRDRCGHIVSMVSSSGTQCIA